MKTVNFFVHLHCIIRSPNSSKRTKNRNKQQKIAKIVDHNMCKNGMKLVVELRSGFELEANEKKSETFISSLHCPTLFSMHGVQNYSRDRKVLHNSIKPSL